MVKKDSPKLLHCFTPIGSRSLKLLITCIKLNSCQFCCMARHAHFMSPMINFARVVVDKGRWKCACRKTHNTSDFYDVSLQKLENEKIQLFYMYYF